jgi:hypothetical protein
MEFDAETKNSNFQYLNDQMHQKSYGRKKCVILQYSI